MCRRKEEKREGGRRWTVSLPGPVRPRATPQRHVTSPAGHGSGWAGHPLALLTFTVPAFGPHLTGEGLGNEAPLLLGVDCCSRGFQKGQLGWGKPLWGSWGWGSWFTPKSV